MLICPASVQCVRRTRAGNHHAGQEKLRDLLASARHAAGLSQRSLSIKLGKQPTYIARVERGERLLELFEFVEICGAVDASPVTLLSQILE